MRELQLCRTGWTLNDWKVKLNFRMLKCSPCPIHYKINCLFFAKSCVNVPIAQSFDSTTIIGCLGWSKVSFPEDTFDKSPLENKQSSRWHGLGQLEFQLDPHKLAEILIVYCNLNRRDNYQPSNPLVADIPFTATVESSWFITVSAWLDNIDMYI